MFYTHTDGVQHDVPEEDGNFLGNISSTDVALWNQSPPRLFVCPCISRHGEWVFNLTWTLWITAFQSVSTGSWNKLMDREARRIKAASASFASNLYTGLHSFWKEATLGKEIYDLFKCHKAYICLLKYSNTFRDSKCLAAVNYRW